MTTEERVLVHVVVVLVKVKVGVPAATPVTTPALVTVAMAALLVAHVPPVVGEIEVVPPAQMGLDPVTLTIGKATTVTADVVALQVVVEFVNVKVGEPAATPVTAPALVTVARLELLLAQVPPDVGETAVVSPTQMELPPVILTVGNELTGTALVVLLQPGAVELVKVKVGLPAATPVTTPALVTVAKPVLLLTHVPPVVGESVVVLPIHTEVVPVMPTVGKAFTVPVTAFVFEVAPVEVKDTFPEMAPKEAVAEALTYNVVFTALLTAPFVNVKEAAYPLPSVVETSNPVGAVTLISLVK